MNYRDAAAIDQLRAFSPQFDRIVEVALGANLDIDLALSGPRTVIVDYAAEAEDPVLPVRRCMTANVALRFVLLYGVPAEANDEAAAGITAALADGALSALPITRFLLNDIAAAQDAVEARTVGKVVVEIP